MLYEKSIDERDTMKEEQVITIPLSRMREWLVRIYLFFLAVILPFFHMDGFVMIGDRKYRLFFMVSVIVLPICWLLKVIEWIGKKLEKSLDAESRTTTDETYWSRKDKKEIFSKSAWKYINWKKIAMMAMALYALFSAMSTFFSIDRQTAIWGYTDWHMGLISQLLFVLIFFTFAFLWKPSVLDLMMLMVSSAGICLLGILNRFAIDPLRMYQGLEYWNKTHLLATIGNINWYCGFVCVTFPIGMWMYLDRDTIESQSRTTEEQAHTIKGVLIHMALICVQIVTFGTLITQGSTSGLITLGVVTLFFFGCCINRPGGIRRFGELLVLWGITGLAIRLWYFFSDKEQIYFATDLGIEQILESPLILLMTLLGLGILAVRYIPVKRSENLSAQITQGKSRGDRRTGLRQIQKIYFVLLGIVIAVGTVAIWNWMPDSWGSGRGYLWRLVVRAFGDMPFYRRLIGVGPDCFAPYMYSHYGAELEGFLAEWWGNALVANAHNEWLNTLINMGLLGLVPYVTTILGTIIFLIVKIKEQKSDEKKVIRNNWCRYALLGCIIAYCVNNTASFQQVMSTPYLFMMLGMCMII